MNERDDHPKLEPSPTQGPGAPDDTAWASFLSGAAKLRPADHAAADAVLSSLRAARQASEPAPDTASETGGDAAWAAYLSGGATLRPVDFEATGAVLTALRRQRAQAGRQRVLRWRGLAAGFSLAAAAVVAGVLVLRAPNVAADPNEAYQAYQEASQGW